IKTPAADPRNSVTEMIRQAPEGVVAPVKADIHTPEITSTHTKELAYFLGAYTTGIVRLGPQDAEHADGHPFAVVCLVKADYEPRTAPGFGGQVPVQNAQYVTFVVAAYIRELGYRATTKIEMDGERLAAAAGLGKLNADGRLVTPKYGTHVHVGDVILT